LIIENITNNNIKQELKLLENKYKIIKEVSKYLLSDTDNLDIFTATYNIIKAFIMEKSKLDNYINEYVSYEDIINYLAYNLNIKYLNYPYIEFVKKC